MILSKVAFLCYHLVCVLQGWAGYANQPDYANRIPGRVRRGVVRKEVNRVKKGIHPEYMKSKIVCACGSVYDVESIKKELRVEICSNCHPFFTGKQKFVDTGGRVERFKRKYGLE